MELITCYPELPHVNCGLWRHAAMSGRQITGELDPDRPVVAWVDGTWRRELPELEPYHVLNRRAVDISKTILEKIYSEISGLQSFVDPETWPVVYEKSDENARKGGRILYAPQPPRPGCVYQQYLVGDEYRLWAMGAMLPAALCRGRAVRPAEILSAPEIVSVVKTLRAMGADYAELDLVRESSSGELFLIDVNVTPWFGAAGADSLNQALVLSWCRPAFEELLRGR